MARPTTLPTVTELAAATNVFAQTPRNSKRHYGNAVRFVNRHIQLAVREGEMAYTMWEVVQGVSWARETCRISGAAEMTLRSMRPLAYIKLLVAIAAEVSVQGDVPRVLNSML